jgi:hypothetical protein
MLETSESWLSAKIVRVDNHEATTCLKKVEAYVALLLFIAITVLIKRYVFRPVLELHLKKKFAERLRSRRRRLKDLLNDQTLLAGLERKLEQRYNGTPVGRNGRDRRRRQKQGRRTTTSGSSLMGGNILSFRPDASVFFNLQRRL